MQGLCGCGCVSSKKKGYKGIWIQMPLFVPVVRGRVSRSSTP